MAEETTKQQQPGAAARSGTGGGGNGYNGGPPPDASPASSAFSGPRAGQPDGSGPGNINRNGRIENEPTLSGQLPKAKGPTSGRKLLIGTIAVVLVLVVGGWGISFLNYSRTHTSTDDAYVTGNLVNVSPIIGGTLSALSVSEGDTVKRGQLIGRLEDSGQKAALRQALAAYQAALSQVPEARTSLLYTQQQTDAAIHHAEAALQAQEARTRGAEAQRQLAAETTRNQVAQAEAQVSAARAQAAQADAQVGTSEAALHFAEQGITTAERGVTTLKAKILAAQGEVNRTQADVLRYGRLLKVEAVTQQQYDSVESQAETAQSNLDSLNQQIDQAQSQVDQANDNVGQAKAQLEAVRQSDLASHQQIDVARAGVGIAQANLFQNPVQQNNVNAATATNQQSNADIQNAESGQTQVSLQQQRIATAQAQAAQAKAALANAQVAENDTYLYAPADGTVVRKSANVGASLSPGQTVVTITQGGYVWVTGNFKETQLTSMRVGQPAEVSVDAFPHKTFKGVVASINEATGATMSLLPPDNATGNFTKVVQRIPVRIALVAGDGSDEANADDLALLRQGMSVTATVNTSDITPHPDKVPQNYDGNGSNGYGTISSPIGQSADGSQGSADTGSGGSPGTTGVGMVGPSNGGATAGSAGAAGATGSVGGQ
jgi:membrane fusion protein (multidrug efflux system)